MAKLLRSETVLPVLPEQDIEIPMLGGSATLRAMALSTYSEYVTAIESARHKAIPEFLARSIFDAEDQPLLDADGWDRLGGINHEGIWVLYKAARDINGLPDNSVAVDDPLADEKKDSASLATDSSSSPLPETLAEPSPNSNET